MEEAAGCYERAAEQYEICRSAHESARAYVEAAKCRKSVAPSSAVDAFGKVQYFMRLLKRVVMLVLVYYVHTTCQDTSERIRALRCTGNPLCRILPSTLRNGIHLLRLCFICWLCAV